MTSGAGSQSKNVLTEESTSRYVQAGDLQMHYNEAGEGPPLVMLHGGGAGASSWSNFKQNLPALSEHFRCLLVDLPGFGKSDKPIVNEPIWDFYTKVLNDMLGALGIERAHFAGNSHGGATAVKMALNYPNRVDRLVSMGGGALTVKLFTPTNIYRRAGAGTISFFSNPSREGVRAFLEGLVYDKGFITDDLVEERFQAALDPEHQRAMIHVFTAWANDAATGPIMDANAWRQIHTIQHRTLLTWGRDDWNPFDGTFYALQQMPDCRLVVFPRCGHWVMVEHSDEWERTVIGFLEAE